MTVEHFDVIVGGTGFASTFFIHGLLKARPGARVLVLERGYLDDYAWMIDARRQSRINSGELFRTKGMTDKRWLFTVGMGGGSNCWWGQTPRFLPEDFELASRYGQGRDWPIGYTDLEPYYDEAERLIGVAGPASMPFPRQGPYPQPPHPMSGFDRAMIGLVGADQWVAAPTARSSTGTAARGKCCASGVCGLCPVDAKFRVMNEMAGIYAQPQITLTNGARILTVDIANGLARGVTWQDESGVAHSATADLVFLGCNALFNAEILLRSKAPNALIGQGLHEQVSRKLLVDLPVENFDGGTHITGLGYMFASGERRRTEAACLVENYNAPIRLRSEQGKWRQRAVLKITAENLPDPANRVSLEDDVTVAGYYQHSDYALKGLDSAVGSLIELLAPLGVEETRIGSVETTEGHILGTAPMGTSSKESVVDHALRHHDVLNLLIGGGSAFPSGPVANPSLTIAALSLRAADLL